MLLNTPQKQENIKAQIQKHIESTEDLLSEYKALSKHVKELAVWTNSIKPNSKEFFTHIHNALTLFGALTQLEKESVSKYDKGVLELFFVRSVITETLHHICNSMNESAFEAFLKWGEKNSPNKS